MGAIGCLAEGGGRATHVEFDTAYFLGQHVDTWIGKNFHGEWLAGCDRGTDQAEFESKFAGQEKVAAFALRVTIGLNELAWWRQCSWYGQLGGDDQR